MNTAQIRVEDIVKSFGYESFTDAMAEIKLIPSGMLIRNFKNILFIPTGSAWSVRCFGQNKENSKQPYGRQGEAEKRLPPDRIMANMRLIDAQSQEKAGLALFVMQINHDKTYEQVSECAAQVLKSICEEIASAENKYNS